MSVAPGPKLSRFEKDGGYYRKGLAIAIVLGDAKTGRIDSIPLGLASKKKAQP